MSSSAFGIGYDTTFELNEFGQPRIRSEIELIMNVILFVLLAKPGQYPSLPWIGLDIQTMLYSFYDDIDVDNLRTRIVDQCSALGVFFDKDVIGIMKTKYRDQPSLLIHIEGRESYPDGYLRDQVNETDRYLIGISFDMFKKMVLSIRSQGGS